MSEPAETLASIRDLSARIDRLYNDHDRPAGALWKGRKSAAPFDYGTALRVQQLTQERRELQADLPPLAAVQGGPF